MTEGVATVAEGLAEPPLVSGGEGEEHGHLEELRHDPIALMRRVRAECGDVGRFRLAGRDVVLLTGAEANELYFRAPEEQLDQAEAYPFMTPIFGEGVVFDAPPERRREMLHNQALRDKFMRGHAATIAAEVDAMVAGWGDEGEIDLLEWFAELTIYTSSACLIGRQVPRRARPRGSPASTTTSNRAPTPSPTSTPTRRSRASVAGTRPAPAWSGWCRRSWSAVPPRSPAQGPTTSATCWTCSCRSPRTTGAHGSGPTS